MKDDEKRFLVDVYKRCTTYFMEPPQVTGRSPRDLINEPGFYMHHKRAWYLLDKWSRKGWYDYGVTLDLGWLTDEGIEAAESTVLVQ